MLKLRNSRISLRKGPEDNTYIISNTMVKSERVSTAPFLKQSKSQETLRLKIAEQYKKLSTFEKTSIMAQQNKTISSMNQSTAYLPKQHEFSMIKQREILSSIKDYHQIHQIIEKNLSYFKSLIKPLAVNYEFFNEITRAELEGDEMRNNAQMEQSIDIFSRIIFSNDLFINHDKQTQILVECFAQLRQNVRHILKGKGSNRKILEQIIDINAIFNNVIFFIDKLSNQLQNKVSKVTENYEDYIKSIKTKHKIKVNDLRSQMDKLKEEHTRQLTEQRLEIRELNNQIRNLESVLLDKEELVKTFQQMKASNELKELGDLAHNMDELLEVSETQKKFLIREKMFKNVEVQTEDILDTNLTIKMKIQSDAKVLRPFINYLDPKTLLDNYTSTYKNLKLDSENDGNLSKIFNEKFIYDITILTSTKDTKLDSYSKFLIRYFIKEYKLLDLSIINLCQLFKDTERNRTPFQQLQWIMLGLKKKFRYFEIPNIQFLVLGLFEDQKREEFEITDAIKYLFRVRQIYPSVIQTELKEERKQIIQQLLVFMLLKKEFQDLEIWDFISYQKNIERARRLIEVSLYSHPHHVVDNKSLLGPEKEYEMIEAKRLHLIKSQSSTKLVNPYKRQEVISADSGNQLLNHLAQLILSVVIKDQEVNFYKKLKTAFDENDLGKNGYIYQEQIKDVLRKLLSEFLTDFLQLVLNEYICKHINEVQITHHRLELFFKHNLGHLTPIPIEILLRVMCYKVSNLAKYERKIILREMETILQNFEFEKSKTQIVNYNYFKDIFQSIIGLHVKVDEFRILDIFQEVNSQKDKLLRLKDKSEFLQCTAQIISKFHPLIHFNDLLNSSNSKQLEKQLQLMNDKAFRHSKVSSHQSAILGSVVSLSSRQSFKGTTSSANSTTYLRRTSTLRQKF